MHGCFAIQSCRRRQGAEQWGEKMSHRRIVPGLAAGLIFTAFLSAPVPVQAADLKKGASEMSGILDGVFNRHFRRSMRVRAALHECELDEQAAELAPTSAERDRGAYDFAKEIHESDSADVKAYMASLADDEHQSAVLKAVYAAALATYVTGVADGASGSLIWVDDDDKKKLCNYMVNEAREFLRLREDAGL